MKNSERRHETGIIRVALVAALSFGGVSCRLPARETWTRIQNHGLIPVLLTPRPKVPTESAPVYAGTSSPSSSFSPATGVNPAPLPPQSVSPPYAEAVSGRPGYVISPFAGGEKQIDVRAFHADQTLRCPYTLKSFRVPSAALANLASETREEQPRVSPRSESSSRQRVVVHSRRERSPERLPEPGSPPPSVAEQVPMPEAPARVPETPAVIPYATHVAGRPGFVHSPFAQKHQLVDVTGIAPGVEVKCPYTDKPFRVPAAEDQGSDSFAAPAPSSPAPAPASDAGGSAPPQPSSPDTGTPSQPAPLQESPAVKEITPPGSGQ